MTSSSFRLSQDSKDVHDVGTVAAYNGLIISATSFFTSLEFAFGRFLLKNPKWSLQVGVLRALLLISALVRCMFIYTHGGCSDAELRYWLADWTAVYPLDRRESLLKVFMCMCVTQLMMRRAILFKKPFDTSLIDHLSNNPRGADSMISVEADTSAKNSLAGSSERSFFEHLILNYAPRANIRTAKSHEPPGSLGMLFRSGDHLLNHTKLDNHFLGSDIKERALIFERNQEHWRVVSLALQSTFVKICICIGIPGVLATLISVFRILFLRKSRSCDVVSLGLRFFGSLELTFVVFDFMLSLIGMATYVSLVQFDLDYLFKISEVQMNQIIEASVEEQKKREGWQPASQQINSVNRTYGKAQDVLFEKFEGEHLQSLAAQTRDGHQAARVNRAQLAIVRYLTALDRHKPIMSFLGFYNFFWMLISLSFVPILTTTSWTQEKMAFVAYLFFATIPAVSCMWFSIICGGICQRATNIGNLIFKLNDAPQSRATMRRWNTVLMLWFNPNRCAFSVGNILELTYVNILKSISFILSGYALILNYSRDRA